jgi:hypothetical protein
MSSQKFRGTPNPSLQSNFAVRVDSALRFEPAILTQDRGDSAGTVRIRGRNRNFYRSIGRHRMKF